MALESDKLDPVAAHMALRPRISIMGVEYLHLQLEDGSDLYLTEYGRPFSRNLLPENHWSDREWFAAHRTKLAGTSAVYRVQTKQVAGVSKDIVLKWNRMGQDIPGETEASDLNGAKFNSPFEEFSLVIELRNTCYETPGRLYTHKPLGIYVPREYIEADRMGRKRYILDGVQRAHDQITLDMHRQYAVIYEWIKGVDAAEAFKAGMFDADAMRTLILRSNQEMKDKGFWVRDSKPHHIIVRPLGDGRLLRDAEGSIKYALVDFELLERTPEREHTVRLSKRKTYLVKQAHRFEADNNLPPDLTAVNIMGVDYVYGQVESTGGRLWVVGKDAALFEYFLPERWRRTPRTELSTTHDIYRTVTKDGIHLVWRISKVGKKPNDDPPMPDEQAVCAYGYNSPFEEVSLSLQLSRSGIETVYPRAIYMTGHKSEVAPDLVDNSRYESHKDLKTPQGHPILGRHHEHMIIWGYWNGPDELLAVKDEEIYTGVDALTAYGQRRITEEEYVGVIETSEQRLAQAGIRDLNLRGSHLLLSLDRAGNLVTDDRGIPAVRICNFELLRHMDESDRSVILK